MKMPVFCIANGCDNDKRSAPEGTSFHCLLLNKPSLLKQMRILFNTVHIYMGNHLDTVAEQLTVGGPFHI